MDNIENSSNGQSSFGAGIPALSEIDIAPKKIRTRPYKTELGKMTRSRNSWRFAAFFFCAAELLRVINSARNSELTLKEKVI